MEWKYPLADPDLGVEEIEAVTKVLQSKWLTQGPVTEEFERTFAAKLGVRHAFAVSNCTAALHIANLALGIGPGDEVICPALTFVASANATRYTGASVILADVTSEQDLCIDPADIELRITPKTRAITVVHYAGFVCDMEAIMSIAHRHGLKVIEDCAHAPFAQYAFPGGRTAFAGAIGDIGCFSFFGNKNITTGEGGMLTTNDDALAAKVRLLRSHGMTTLTYDRHRGHASGYDVVSLGYNYRCDEIRSAIGLCQLTKVDRLNAARRKVVLMYREALAEHKSVILPFRDRDLEPSSCHIMSVMVTHDLDGVRKRFHEARIQTSKHYDLISDFSAYAGSGFETRYPHLRNLLTLPLYPALTTSDVRTITSYLGR